WNNRNNKGRDFIEPKPLLAIYTGASGIQERHLGDQSTAFSASESALGYPDVLAKYAAPFLGCSVLRSSASISRAVGAVLHLCPRSASSSNWHHRPHISTSARSERPLKRLSVLRYPLALRSWSFFKYRRSMSWRRRIARSF